MEKWRGGLNGPRIHTERCKSRDLSGRAHLMAGRWGLGCRRERIDLDDAS